MAGTSPDGQVDELFEALERYDHASVDRILRERPELVNFRQVTDAQDTTPLLKVCAKGALDVAKVLIKNGADVRCTGCIGGYHRDHLGHLIMEPHYNEGGYSICDDTFPLFFAVSTVVIPLVQELINAGADPNQVNAAGQSALHAASANKDGSHLARFSNLGYKPKRKADAAEVMRILIDNGANLNIQDNCGRTPLYYACMSGNLYLMKLLLEYGADSATRDKNGLNILEIAALRNYGVMEELLQMCPWSDQEKVEAYELSALSGYDISSASLLKGMSKATYLRVELNCPKVIAKPLPCYGNRCEWTTLCEIERLKDDLQALREQCLMAMERIFQGRHLPLNQTNFTEVIMGVRDRKQQNALLRHYLDVFRRNDDYLYFVESFMNVNRLLKAIAFEARTDTLETETIVDVFNLALESALKMKHAIDTETKKRTVWELITQLEQTILTAASYIVLLLRRTASNDDSSEYDLARSLLRKLADHFPHVSCSATCYYNPLLHILLNKQYLSFQSRSYPFLPDIDILKMLLEFGSNVNETDSEGNTPLHVAVCPFLIPIGGRQVPMNCPDPNRTAEEVVRLFLDKGAYVHARNKRKVTVFDIVSNSSHAGFYHEASDIPKTLDEHRGLPTLKRLAAEYLSDSNITYNKLPEALQEFVNLH